jgi:A/G-specific adenine glycosylase
VAFASDRIAEFPGRKAKKPKPLRTTNMALVHCDDAIYLERRPAAGIWGGLWSFPELAPADEVADWCQDQVGSRPLEIKRWDVVRHSFTHFDLDIEPIAVRVSSASRKVADSEDRVWYEIDSPQKLGIAAPVSGLIEKLKELRTHVPNS